MRNLRAEKERVIAAATDEDEAQERAHRARHLRTWARGVETHGAFCGPTTEVHKLLDALEPLRKQAFEQARAGEGPRESQDAYLFDALVALGAGEASVAMKPVGRVRVDITPLLTGKTEPGEICEIPGVGPVPVSHACCVCDATEHLERHHVEGFAEHQLTAYEILGRLCPPHHDMVTYDGYTIEIHDDGSWTLRPPEKAHGEQRDTDAA